jgi:protein TonB
MTAIVSNILDTLPNYGAQELKGFIRKYTIRGFIITASIFLLLFLLYFLYVEITEAGLQAKKLAPIAKMRIEDLTPLDEANNEPPPPVEQIINAGPAARAGTPVPVPDAQITPDMQEFATVDIQSRASSEGGSGLDLGGFSSNINFDQNSKVDVKVKEKEPEPDEFIPVEKEPGVDYSRLQGLVKYPDLAKRAGIEGRVVLRVLVDKDGSARKYFIEDTENELLNQAAIDAVKAYGRFKPAIQNQEPIMCWISIPIQFRLR